MTIRRCLSRFSLTLLAAATAAVIAVIPAAAMEPFSGPTSIVGASCAFGTAETSDSVNGTVRGAFTCNAEADSPISIFWYQGGVKTVRHSPYTGQLIAAAWDGSTSLYILYQQAKSLKIAKVSDAGSFSAVTVLSTSLAAYTSGDLVASQGKWWAVWHETVGSQAELFQARTLLGTQHRTRITSSAAQDLEPSLAYSGGRLEMAWSRYTADLGAADLWVGRNTGAGWVTKVLATSGTHNNMPDIAGSGGRFYLSWTRDGVINAGDNTSGSWVTRTFSNHGYNPRIAAAAGKVFVSYEAVNLQGKIYVVERSAGRWTGGAVTGIRTGNVGIAAGNGSASIVYYSNSGLSARTQ